MLSSLLWAHDLPQGLTVHAWLRPDTAANKVEVLVRVPLLAIRDVELPQTSPGGPLDVPRLLPQLPDAAMLWLGNVCEIYDAGGTRLSKPAIVRLRIASLQDKPADSWASAVESLAVDVPAGLLPNQAALEVLFEYSTPASIQGGLSIRTGWWHLASSDVTTVLRYVDASVPGNPVKRAFQYHGDPGVIPMDPGWWQASSQFLWSGFLHILEGPDHLLFVLCLVIPFAGRAKAGFKDLLILITSFTAAHSITLAASALDFAPGAAWFPPLIETLIAASILFMAAGNIIATLGTANQAARHRWIIAFVFGLAHGFGFSFALRETLQFAGSHLATALLSFNAGVELGQLLVVGLTLPLLSYLPLFRRPAVMVVLSLLVAHTGWHWMLERAQQLFR